MRIKTIVIETEAGADIEIARTDAGALVTAGNRVVCEMRRSEDRDDRYVKALEAAKAVYGADKRGRAAATNSMVHDLLDHMERIAGV